MKGWATRSSITARVPVEKATMTAVVTPHILYFRKEGTQDRNQPSTRHSELHLLHPYLSPLGTAGQFMSHVPCLKTGS